MVEKECPAKIGMKMNLPRGLVEIAGFQANATLTPAEVVEIKPLSKERWEVAYKLDNSGVIVYTEVFFDGESPQIVSSHKMKLGVGDLAASKK